MKLIILSDDGSNLEIECSNEAVKEFIRVRPIAERFGLRYEAVVKRLQRGWPVGLALQTSTEK